MEYKVEELLQNFGDDVFRFIFSILKEENDAEDVFQETFLKIYSNLKNFKEKSSIKTWIFKIAMNEARRYLKFKKNKKETLDMDESMNLAIKEEAYITLSQEEREDMENALKKLSEKDREIVHLYFYEEMDYKNIAAVLNIPVGTVKSRLYYAKENLKKFFGDENEKI